MNDWVKDETVRRHAREVRVMISAKPPLEILSVAKNLRMVHTIGSGFEGDLDYFSKRGIIVCSTVGMNAFVVAEHAMALILSLAKSIPEFNQQLKAVGWEQAKFPVMLLRNKTLGIVGFGSIGVELTKRVKPFGMNVIAIKKNPSPGLKLQHGLKFLGGPADLAYIMRESDIVVLCQTSTPETKGMIGETELRMMKNSAYLINVSRGAVLDEKALITVLKDGTIRGAGLDVFASEPTSRANPLLKMDNVLVTPHVAGGANAIETAIKLGREDDISLLTERSEFIMRNIERFLTRKTPHNIINPNVAK